MIHNANTQVLEHAAHLIRSRWPELRIQTKFAGVLYLVRYEFPGVVQVYDFGSGRPVCRSLPGRPFVLDLTPDTSDAS